MSASTCLTPRTRKTIRYPLITGLLNSTSTRPQTLPMPDIVVKIRKGPAGIFPARDGLSARIFTLGRIIAQAEFHRFGTYLIPPILRYPV
jgi:hypothetical protein